MSEYKVYHDVSELLKLFDHKLQDHHGSQTNAAAYSEILLKNRTPNVSVPVQGLAAIKSLAEGASDPDALLKKYETIQMKNRRELDPTVSLIAHIVGSDKKGHSVKHFLKRNAELRLKKAGMAEPSYNVGETYFEKEELTSKDKNSSENTEPSLSDECSLNWDFIPIGKRDNIGHLGELPLNVQESKLIDELLFCFEGINGNYVYSQSGFDASGLKQFSLDETCDSSLQELVKRMLPICTFYSTIVRFIEDYSRFDHGLVSHALAAAMRHLLKDFYILVAQLEHQFSKGMLSLQKMWFYLQPTRKNLEMLSFVCNSVIQGECHGGTILSVLHKIITSQTGDTKMQDLLTYLLKASCTPYFEILEKWIYKGIIYDPYHEFLVVDNQTDKQKDNPSASISDEYWEKKYTISREQIPLFLERISDMILKTGKYLNVIQQCGHKFSYSGAEKIVYSVEERQYMEQTEKAYNYASKTLLDLLMGESDLIGRLRSLKHYFLMDQGDFIVQFMDMAEAELDKDVDDIIPTRLEFLLELALRTSVVNFDKYKDDLGINILEYDLVSQMFKILQVEPLPMGFTPSAMHEFYISGIEAFVFRYTVKWPLSLVINRHAMACYQMLFRHLFYCKYVGRLLGNVWSMNKVAKSYSLDSSRGYASAFALRQQMLSFVQAVEYYMNFEVIEPNWHILTSKMHEVSNVDEVLMIHNKFLESCLKDCMLTLPEMLFVLVKLLKLCVAFGKFMKKTHKGAVEAELSLLSTNTVPNQSSAPSSLKNEQDQPSNKAPVSFRQKIAEFQEEFNRLLHELLNLISNHDKEHYSDKLGNMWNRLDFNGFYVTEFLPKSVSIS